MIRHIRAGKMRALAVTGVKNVEVASWQAIVAPKGLPPALRDKAHAAFVEALNDPRVREQFVSIGHQMVAGTPQQFAELQRQE
ncbi:tripartite tricarboxylate transporter substrate-binding protein [Delftia sp. UME58]|uniref:tripartite tricarboxylate transporter substrate-binding protein n=1 Tax=Delftia sp. UME58 TaxID=1862322 RepID=UPI0038F7FABF